MLRIFPHHEKVLAAFSDKTDGSLSFKWPGENITENRYKFFKNLGVDVDQLISMEQVHGANVAQLEKKETDHVDGVDGLLTQEKNIILGVETADCVPVFAYNTFTNNVGVAHAGWRGIESSVIESFVNKFSDKPENLFISIGPHIQSCCFEVKSDVQEKFTKYPQAVKLDFGKFYISLSQIIKEKLLALGVHTENIQISKECTCCNEKYFSYRRDKMQNPGAMLGIIMLK
jgi:hypothetical protein